jgi:hypothetical protein
MIFSRKRGQLAATEVAKYFMAWVERPIATRGRVGATAAMMVDSAEIVYTNTGGWAADMLRLLASVAIILNVLHI